MNEELCFSTDLILSMNVYLDGMPSIRYGVHDSLGWLAQKEHNDHRLRMDRTVKGGCYALLGGVKSTESQRWEFQHF